MSSDLKEQILDLIYDLLPEDQAESLRVRIDAEPEVRAVYESLIQKSRLLSEAARLEPEKTLFPILVSKKEEIPQKNPPSSQPEQETNATIAVTHYGKATQYIHAPHTQKRGFQWITREIARRALGEERGINRMVSLGAICLILFSLSGLIFQKNQVDKLSEQSHLYRIAAPPVLVSEQTQTLQVQVSDLVGRPRQIPVRVAVNTLEGEKILAQTQKTDHRGNIILALDARKDLPNEVELEVSIGENPDKKIVSRLPVISQKPQLAVALDKPVYSPQDELHYRVFSISQAVPNVEHQKLDQKLARQTMETSPKSSEMDVWLSENGTSLEIPSDASFSFASTPPHSKRNGGMSGGGMYDSYAKETGEARRMGVPYRFREDADLEREEIREGQVLYSMQNAIAPNQQVIVGSVPLPEQIGDADNMLMLNLRQQQPGLPPVQTQMPVAQARSMPSSTMDSVSEEVVSLEKAKVQPFHLPVPSMGAARGVLQATPPSSSMAPASLSADDDLFEVPHEKVAATEEIASETPDIPPFEVEWVPAGGHFVLGLENRVYFRANRGFQGNLLDQTGKTVTTIETGSDHFGEFHWTPKSGNAYQLAITEAGEPDQRIPLDMKFESLPLSLDIEHVLLAPDASITVSLNARQNDLPVIVTVLKQGIPILAQTEILKRGLNAIAIPLPMETYGLLDVMILEGASDTVQQPLAQQSVFRRPARFLDVNAKSRVTSLQNGNASWNFDVQVLNESGKPAAYAFVGVNVIRNRTNNLFSTEVLSQLPTLVNQLFFSALHVENWEQFETWLNASDEVPFKFLLAKDRTDFADFDEQTLTAIRPLIYDNFQELQSQYHDKVSHFQQTRNSWLRVFMIIGVFGGMGFAVLVMILVTLRLASAVRMFVLTAIVGLSCVFLCLAMLKNQATFSEAFQKTSFASHGMMETGERSLCSDDLQTAHSFSLAQPEPIHALPFLHPSRSPLLRTNAFPDQQSDFAFENILWQPELRTDAQGRVAFDFLVTDAKDASVLVVIDTFDENGRIGSCRIHLPQKNE